VAFELRTLGECARKSSARCCTCCAGRGPVEALVEQINALGYGLTLGVQTRIDTRAQAIAEQADVGNLYVNRNMIGAVVGVQPFGGEACRAPAPRPAARTTCRASAPNTASASTPAAGGDVDLLMAAPH
jgi:RHH-type proline utilization regulon transcriptional repressor/proline dehydrogenase/delta 1-pyrroline-5-carboxylate dehydrogenase